MVERRSPTSEKDHLLYMKIARKISPIIRIGVSMNLGIKGKPHGNPQGKSHGNPMILEKPENAIAQTNRAKRMPNIGDPSLGGPKSLPHSSLDLRAEPQPLQ
jgi:hypothetical protein